MAAGGGWSCVVQEPSRSHPLWEGRRSAPRTADHADTVSTDGGDLGVPSGAVSRCRRGATGRIVRRRRTYRSSQGGRSTSGGQPAALGVPDRMAGGRHRRPGTAGRDRGRNLAAAHGSPVPTGRGTGRTRTYRCLGGSHEGPPFPLRQRRDSTPRWRQPARYAHCGYRRPLRPGVGAVERSIGWPTPHRPSAARFRPTVAVWGVASGCRSLLVHCLPWQRRDRRATIPPLRGGVRLVPP